MAISVAWPLPVIANDPNSSTAIPPTDSKKPLRAKAKANSREARIGPTVWELEGPIPIEKS
jgi:hypothetical protein